MGQAARIPCFRSSLLRERVLYQFGHLMGTPNPTIRAHLETASVDSRPRSHTHHWQQCQRPGQRRETVPGVWCLRGHLAFASPRSPSSCPGWWRLCTQRGLEEAPPTALALQFAEVAAGPTPHLTQPSLIPCMGHTATHTSGRKKLEMGGRGLDAYTARK